MPPNGIPSSLPAPPNLRPLAPAGLNPAKPMKNILLLSLVLLAAGPLRAATYGQKVVAAVLLAEARGEGESGMMAVAEVIRHRADQRGVSLLAVMRPGAFSSLNGTTHEKLLHKFERHPLFPEALHIARLAYNDPEQLGNRTHSATHFTHKDERPYWSEDHTPVAVIGNHAFYRLER